MKNKAIKNVSIVLLCSISAKIFSYIWEALLAASFGTSAQADALYMTIGIFNVLYPVLDLGIWKVFLPIYKTRLVQESESSADRFANVAETLFITISAILVLVIIIFARPLVAIIAAGFSDELKSLTIKYLRCSAPMYFLMMSASVVGAVLQCHDKFLGSQLREVSTHVSKIMIFVICYRLLGIYAAIIALIVGSIFRLLIQLPFIDWEWKFRFDFSFRNKEIKAMLKGLPSVAITAAIAQINALVDKMVASGAVTGAISCLNYGGRLMNIFSGMITNAIGTVIYPAMVQYVAGSEGEKLKKLVHHAVCISVFIILPINVFCMLFSNQIVTIAFQRGAFDSASAAITAQVFSGYTLGMLFIGLTTIITNVFYAYGDTKVTMCISVLDIVLNIVFDLAFSRAWGVAGLAMATSVSAMICFFVRLGLLRRYITIGDRAITVEILKIFCISVAACFCAGGVYHYMLRFNVYINMMICVMLIGILYVAGAAAFKVNTFTIAKNIFLKKLQKNRRGG